MRHAIVITGLLDAAETADAAVAAERAGWDALLVWEVVWGLDAWVRLTAAAAATSTIRLGTMLTPLPRVRPWDLASRAVTLDRFSGGRLQIAVGLGGPHQGWTAFEADPGRRVRAELLTEGLEVYDGLMRGQPFTYTGRHHRVVPTDFMVPPPPVQQPRVPVWVVGAWDAAAASGDGHAAGATASLARAARWDGLVPTVLGEGSTDPGGGIPPSRVRPVADPDELAHVLAATRALREAAGLAWAGYDVVVEGGLTPSSEQVRAWSEAGATWWVGADWEATSRADLERQVAAGPPH